ncbi:MAG: sigma-70 family RNA polymerase sigma factor [Planctomycetota bacterium]
MPSEGSRQKAPHTTQKSEDPRHLVDHFFRHESARVVAVLTRRFGMRHLPLAEDAVQVALSKALIGWSRHGVPKNPTGWLLQVASNHALDMLRRDSRFDRLSEEHVPEGGVVESYGELDQVLEDSLLRMIFACCDPRMPVESQTAIALKILCSFSVREIAKALVSTEDSVSKRITRAKAKLHELGIDLNALEKTDVHDRMASVQHVIYLLFNEGYSSSLPDRPIRFELCEEAVRLAMILAQSEMTSGSEACAFLALLLFHSVRLDARIDEGGAILLFAEQDLEKWDLKLLKEAFFWFEKATAEPILTRYHLEAMIAAEHCRGKMHGRTDWDRVVSGYELLCRIAPSPIHRLNQAIATAHAGDIERGIELLRSIDIARITGNYYLWHAALGDLLRVKGDGEGAAAAYRDACRLAPTNAEKELVCRKLDQLQ